MGYVLSGRLALPFDQALTAVRRALADEGFGVITEIDMTATLASTTGAIIEPYTILGACNPSLAAAALDAGRSVGALLPCNVVVRVSGDDILVEAFDPLTIAQLSDSSGLAEVADDARARLRRVLSSLG